MNKIDMDNACCPETKASNFNCVLAYLILKADPGNLAKLYKGFPDEVVMVCEYFGDLMRLRQLGIYKG